MRVLLVGSPANRARLRSQLNRLRPSGASAGRAEAREHVALAEADGSMEVAGEFASLSAARASEIEVDAIVVAPEGEIHDDPVFPVFDEPLTAREIQVLELLAEGLPNKTIATRLGISDQTVKFHVSSISGKLGAANRTDAVRRAVRRGLITL
jgi:DNA-binding NarL/FixJ family response regulator